MARHHEIAALILAAGYSSRMGKFKPLLPLGNATVVERCVRLFLETGVKNVCVVIGHQAQDLVPVVERLNVLWTINENFQEGMFSSIQAGVRSLNDSVAFFLLPVDIPLVRNSTVIELLNAYHDGLDVLYPCFQGRRGHPPLISNSLFPGILAWKEEGGLRSFLAQHQRRTANVEVPDDNILLDMDTLDQYEKICKKAEFDEISQ
jgi:molybdenum cofactor cytidylyltransferase